MVKLLGVLLVLGLVNVRNEFSVVTFDGQT